MLHGYEDLLTRAEKGVGQLADKQKDFERTNMINWITSKVKKSITSKQEQDTLQACLNQLRQMASQTR